jgi:hypothetical protein
MTEKQKSIKSVVFPLAVLAALCAGWTLVWSAGVFHESAFPSPLAVVRAFGLEIRTGRLANDLIVSLFRVSCGFLIAVASVVANNARIIDEHIDAPPSIDYLGNCGLHIRGLRYVQFPKEPFVFFLP